MTLNARIELEVGDGPQSQRERLHLATPQALRAALIRLDSDRADAIWIEIADAGALCIGGGPAGFVVTFFPTDKSSSHIEIGGDEGRVVELQIGGQLGIYRRAMVLPPSMAFGIAERFLLSGQFDPALNWVEDCPPE